MPDRPDISEIRERFRKIDPTNKRGGRHPHRPLLVLYALGKLQQDQRRIPFEQAEEDFEELFQEFGPPNKTSVKYPFWYLYDTNGVWEVEDAENLPRRSGNGDKEPLVSAMREQNTRGWFTDEVWRALRSRPQLRGEIAQMMLDKCFPETLHQDILDAVGLRADPVYESSKRRPRDPGFRDHVLAAYNYRCAVCGFDLAINDKPVALEAAHIKWHQYDGPDAVSNGLALCALHHTMFDKGVIHVTPNLFLLVAEEVHGSPPHIDRLRERHGSQIDPPSDSDYAPAEEHVRWHVKEVFRDSPYSD